MPSIRIPRAWKFGTIPANILDSNMSIHAKIVIAAIMFHSFDDGPAWPGQARLSRLCSCSVKAIQRGVVELEEKGHLKVERVRGKVNVYEFVNNSGDSGTALPVVDATLRPPFKSKVRSASPTNETIVFNKTNPLPPTAAEVPAKPTANPEIRQFTDWYLTRWKQKFGTPYAFNGPADGPAAIKIVSDLGFEGAKSMVEFNWTQNFKDDWCQSKVVTIAQFRMFQARIVANMPKGGKKSYGEYAKG